MLAGITDDLGATGFDSRYGFGLINADKAVAAAIASTGAAPPVPAGKVIAEPASLDFGSLQTSATISLLYSGSSTEQLVSITSSNPAVSVAAQTVDANGMGTYVVSVNRTSAALTAATNFITLTATLTPARSFTLPVVVTKSTTIGRSGGFGPVYVLLTDASTGNVLHQVMATPTATGYNWTATGVVAGTVAIVAGTDQDNDDFICQRGEACGGYPVLEAVIAGQGIKVEASRGNLNFQVAPISGISAQSTGASRNNGLRRLGHP
jgi:serine protease